jgi:HD-like signal output (HDOD) protein
MHHIDTGSLYGVNNREAFQSMSKLSSNNGVVVADVRLIKSLPPFPLLAQILKSFSRAENSTDIRPLVANIESEPSVAAKVLAVANSAYFHTKEPIVSVREAVSRLGMSQLKKIVFGLVASMPFKTANCPAFVPAKFWHDAMLIAHCASFLTGHIHEHALKRDELYCIGLMRSIGLLALVHLLPDEMNAILNSSTDETLVENEMSVFNGKGHIEFGAALLQHWGLPDEYVVAVANQANPQYRGKYWPIAAALNLAAQLSKSDFAAIDEPLTESLGLSAHDIEEVEKEYRSQIHWIESFALHL